MVRDNHGRPLEVFMVSVPPVASGELLARLQATSLVNDGGILLFESDVGSAQMLPAYLQV